MVKLSCMGTAVLLRRRVPSSCYLRESQMLKPLRMGTAVLLRRCVPSSRYLHETQMVSLRAWELLCRWIVKPSRTRPAKWCC